MTKRGADSKGSVPFCLPDFSIEGSLLESGAEFIAGVDEAGRGALAGPLSVGMVIYPASVITNPPLSVFKLIRDSKVLSSRARNEALEFISAHAIYSSAVMISHKIIDRINVNQATGLALDRLIALAPVKPGVVIMDGNLKLNPGVRYIPVKKGDSLSVTIASASISAKVARDTLMMRLDEIFPGYGFAGHKGYGTACHMEAIRSLGPCRIHRMSYEPMKGAAALRAGRTDEDN